MNDIKNILQIQNNLLKNYFNNNIKDLYAFYINNYAHTDYFLNDSKMIKINKEQNKQINKELNKQINKSNKTKKIDWKYILTGKLHNIFKYKALTFNYYENYQLYMEDRHIFDSTKSDKIAELSVSPSFFEILNPIIDVYVSNDNYYNLDIKEWKNTIYMYKKLVHGNFYYSKKLQQKLKHKYDILIINLVKKYDIFSESTKNLEKQTEKEIKEEIKYLKYMNKNGNAYIYVDFIASKSSIYKLYTSISKKFETIDFFTPKYSDEYNIYGSLWLKCYNYGVKSKLTPKKLKDNFEVFYKKYYTQKIIWYKKFENFIKTYMSNTKNHIQLNLEIVSQKLNFLKDFIEEYNIQINPKWKKIIYEDHYLAQVSKDINYRTTPSNEYNPLFRTLSFTTPHKYYPYGTLETHSLNCHDGQRKLLFSEIEFYTLVREKYDLNNVLVVYAGSADGTHEPIIFDMFPELDFYLCDPNPFHIKHPFIHNKERVKIVNDFYTDETWRDVVKFNKKKKDIIFVSDIRVTETNEAVFNNMIEQQRWIIQLNSVAYMVKFRLLYDLDQSKFNISYEIPSGKNIKAFNKKANISENISENIFNNNQYTSNNFQYLKGEIYLQIYAPITSTETRLVYVKDNKNEKFEIINYNTHDYDAFMYYFNNVDRKKKYYYNNSVLMKYNLLGYDDSYESVSEYFIIEKYLYNKDNLISNKNNTYKDVIQYLYLLDNRINSIIHKNIVLCPFYTLSKNKSIFDRLKESKSKELLMNIKKLYIIYLYSFKNQYYYFGKGTLLDKSEYESMQKDIIHNVELLNKFITPYMDNRLMEKDVLYILIKDLLRKGTNTKSYKHILNMINDKYYYE